MNINSASKVPEEVFEASELPFDKEAAVKIGDSPVEWLSKSSSFLTLKDDEDVVIGASVSHCIETAPNQFSMEASWGRAGKDSMFAPDDVTGVSMKHRSTIVIEYPNDVVVAHSKKNPFADTEYTNVPSVLDTTNPYASPRTDISRRNSSLREGLRSLLGI